jgi:hypothetical protein
MAPLAFKIAQGFGTAMPTKMLVALATHHPKTIAQSLIARVLPMAPPP